MRGRETDANTPKPDFRLALGYGSAWHLLRCLGWQRERFTSRIANDIGADSLRWLDFPSNTGGQIYPSGAPIRDGEWTGINFSDHPELKAAFAEFWPTKGSQQNWDAIGRAVIDGKEEWILVEAKAHLAEVSDRGTTASEKGGRPKIRRAFEETLAGIGYAEAEAASWAEGWLTGYYQHANRLAALHFFTKNQIPARLVFLYFCGDFQSNGRRCPVDEAGWQPLLEKIHEGLGLKGESALEHLVHNIFVPVELP